LESILFVRWGDTHKIKNGKKKRRERIVFKHTQKLLRVQSIRCRCRECKSRAQVMNTGNILCDSKGLVDKKIALVYGSREPDWYFPWSRGTVPCWSPAFHQSYNKVAPFPSPRNLKEEEVLIVGYPLPLRRAVKDHTPFLH
ncbi:hypothetical protein J6590_091169, partial [Homalodisca vitripennis]